MRVKKQHLFCEIKSVTKNTGYLTTIEKRNFI